MQNETASDAGTDDVVGVAADDAVGADDADVAPPHPRPWGNVGLGGVGMMRLDDEFDHGNDDDDGERATSE